MPRSRAISDIRDGPARSRRLLSTKRRRESSRKGEWLPKKSEIRTILLTFLNVRLTTPKLNPFQTGENRKAAIV